MAAAMPLLAQLRGSVQYNADTDPALQESWRLLRSTQNATQAGLARNAGESMLKRWQSVHRDLPRDLQGLIGPCMATAPEAIQLTIDGWELIAHAREKEHGRQRSSSIERANAMIGRAQRLVTEAMTCWYDAKREYVRRGGRRSKEQGREPPPNPPPPLTGNPAVADCRSAAGRAKLDAEGYALERVDGRNMDFGLAEKKDPNATHPDADERRVARIVSSGTYTLNHGVDPVGPLLIRKVNDIVHHIRTEPQYVKGLEKKKNGKSIVGRGGVWIMGDGSILIGRQSQDVYDAEKLKLLFRKRVRAFMGGGAILIDGRRMLKDDDLAGVQGFDGGLGSLQLGGPAHRIMFGDCAGTIYWIATPNVTGPAAQKHLYDAEFRTLVSFDGGSGAYAFGHRNGFDGRDGKGANQTRIYIDLK